jgi:hypothetical protein
MYFPYFRGKQYELVTIRECSPMLASARFTPILEPVKEDRRGLLKTVEAISEANASLVLVLNPKHGSIPDNPEFMERFVADELGNYPQVKFGALLFRDSDVTSLRGLLARHSTRSFFLVHAGFQDARALSEALSEVTNVDQHIFLEPHCGKLYAKNFRDTSRVLLRDGFKRKANRNYDDVEFFSDLHATYPDEGMAGFGDFLIVGDEYSETGGPAYAVAIHVTFIDPEKDDAMYVFHFKSDRQDSPTDPAGKFAEALEKLYGAVSAPNSKIYRTEAINEFLDLRQRRHFPGLGYVKKLSMKHHIETLVRYFQRINE